MRHFKGLVLLIPGFFLSFFKKVINNFIKLLTILTVLYNSVILIDVKGCN
jgi:hypothetical protein